MNWKEEGMTGGVMSVGVKSACVWPSSRNHEP